MKHAADRLAMPYGWGKVAYSLGDRQPWMNLPFPVSEYEQRIARLQAAAKKAGFDLVLVAGDPGNGSYIRYLTNFEDFYGGQSIAVVPTSGEPGFTTNAVMHGEPMHSGIQDCWITDVRCAAAPRTVTGNATASTVFDHVEDFINDGHQGVRIIGLAGPTLPGATEFLARAFPKVQVRPATELLDEMCKIKSPAEVEVLRAAAKQADAAVIAAMGAVREGVSEFDIAAAATEAMFRAGAEHVGFAISVVAGERAGFKHMAPTANRVREGDVVYVDLGSRNMGYYSDCSRQTVCGKPSPEQLRFMETQVSIVEECTKRMEPGVTIASIGEVALRMAQDAGYADNLYFRGHGIGCNIQNRPAFAPGNQTKLERGMVFAFEPMLVKFKFGTACWEDVWHVTTDGVERLNASPFRFW
ncbi:MAG: M24 family metallopeptidase [Candidatus Dormibacteraceae bacterium]